MYRFSITINDAKITSLFDVAAIRLRNRTSNLGSSQDTSSCPSFDIFKQLITTEYLLENETVASIKTFQTDQVDTTICLSTSVDQMTDVTNDDEFNNILSPDASTDAIANIYVTTNMSDDYVSVILPSEGSAAQLFPHNDALTSSAVDNPTCLTSDATVPTPSPCVDNTASSTALEQNTSSLSISAPIEKKSEIVSQQKVNDQPLHDHPLFDHSPAPDVQPTLKRASSTTESEESSKSEFAARVVKRFQYLEYGINAISCEWIVQNIGTASWTRDRCWVQYIQGDFQPEDDFASFDAPMLQPGQMGVVWVRCRLPNKQTLLETHHHQHQHLNVDRPPQTTSDEPTFIRQRLHSTWKTSNNHQLILENTSFRFMCTAPDQHASHEHGQHTSSSVRKEIRGSIMRPFGDVLIVGPRFGSSRKEAYLQQPPKKSVSQKAEDEDDDGGEKKTRRPQDPQHVHHDNYQPSCWSAFRTSLGTCGNTTCSWFTRCLNHLRVLLSAPVPNHIVIPRVYYNSQDKSKQKQHQHPEDNIPSPTQIPIDVP